MATNFDVELQPTQLFRLVTKPADPRISWRISVESKRPIDTAFVLQTGDAGPAFDFREPDLPTTMRIRSTWRILGDIQLEVRASPLGERTWQLQFTMRDGRAVGAGRLDLIEIEGDRLLDSRRGGASAMTTVSRSLVLKLTNVAHDGDPEGVSVTEKRWHSPGSGWLGAQEGGWISTADGLHLRAGQGTKESAICLGLFFAIADKGDSGRSHYPDAGGAGGWEVIDVVEVI